MVAIIGGLGAALSWAISTLASSRSSRMIGAASVLGWVMAVGLAVAIGPALLLSPVTFGPPELAGLVVLGLMHNAGLLLVYRALSIGQVAIVAPIVATEGALAALIAVLFGESLALSTAAILAVIATGVVLAAAERPRDDPGPVDPALARRAAILAMGAAAAFSVGLYLGGRLGAAGVPPVWVIVVSRFVGVVVVALPLIAMRRFRITRRAAPLVVLSGILEASGTALYVVAATHGVAVAAVLSSQFAAIAAVGGFLLFRERLQRHQVVGVITIAVGVTILAATTA